MSIVVPARSHHRAARGAQLHRPRGGRHRPVPGGGAGARHRRLRRHARPGRAAWRWPAPTGGSACSTSVLVARGTGVGGTTLAARRQRRGPPPGRVRPVDPGRRAGARRRARARDDRARARWPHRDRLRGRRDPPGPGHRPGDPPRPARRDARRRADLRLVRARATPAACARCSPPASPSSAARTSSAPPASHTACPTPRFGGRISRKWRRSDRRNGWGGGGLMRLQAASPADWSWSWAVRRAVAHQASWSSIVVAAAVVPVRSRGWPASSKQP